MSDNFWATIIYNLNKQACKYVGQQEEDPELYEFVVDMQDNRMLLHQALTVTRLEQGCENSNLYQEIGNTAEAGTHRQVRNKILHKPSNNKHGIKSVKIVLKSFWFSCGNIFYVSRFVIISKWKNEGHLDNHMKTAHVKEFAKSFADHTSVEQMRRYQQIF